MKRSRFYQMSSSAPPQVVAGPPPQVVAGPPPQVVAGPPPVTYMTYAQPMVSGGVPTYAYVAMGIAGIGLVAAAYYAFSEEKEPAKKKDARKDRAPKASAPPASAPPSVPASAPPSVPASAPPSVPASAPPSVPASAPPSVPASAPPSSASEYEIVLTNPGKVQVDYVVGDVVNAVRLGMQDSSIFDTEKSLGTVVGWDRRSELPLVKWASDGKISAAQRALKTSSLTDIAYVKARDAIR